jgi:hypothetical protein
MICCGQPVSAVFADETIMRCLTCHRRYRECPVCEEWTSDARQNLCWPCYRRWLRVGRLPTLEEVRRRRDWRWRQLASVK